MARLPSQVTQSQQHEQKEGKQQQNPTKLDVIPLNDTIAALSEQLMINRL